MAFRNLPLWVLTPLILFKGSCASQAYGQTERPKRLDMIGLKGSAFSLKTSEGRSLGWKDFRGKKAVAVVFAGTGCRLVNLYLVRLAELQNEFGSQGLQILAINSNEQDSPEEIAHHAKERKLPFPVLVDPGQKVADGFGAERTPEVFLLDSDRVVRYHGRIDDRWSVAGDRSSPTRHDLAEAIREVLAGKPVSAPRTAVEGCFIGRSAKPEPKTSVTYAKHVALILQNHCQECHRPGQIGPFELSTYEQARAWSDTIREVVQEGRMPPWNADPKHGDFANDRTLPEKDRKTLLDWIDHGCPKGLDADLPPAKRFADGWGMGEPDRVLSMKEAFKVPASPPKGGIPYQRFELATHFDRDMWVQAAEARPGNRAVVHHMLAFIGAPPGSDAEITGDRNVLVGYVPGNKPMVFPPSLGVKIPKGAKLVLEMHYTANGTEQSDLSSIGLIFAKEPPQYEVGNRFVLDRTFAIPPRRGPLAELEPAPPDAQAIEQEGPENATLALRVGQAHLPQDGQPATGPSGSPIAPTRRSSARPSKP
jgi:peroxiredoxin